MIKGSVLPQEEVAILNKCVCLTTKHQSMQCKHRKNCKEIQRSELLVGDLGFLSPSLTVPAGRKPARMKPKWKPHQKTGAT
jgi:hypothetical protein